MSGASQQASTHLYVEPLARAEPLRVGLLLDASAVPRWISHIVAEIQASTFARVTLIALNRGGTSGIPRHDSSGLLYRAYIRSEIRRHRGSESPFLLRDLTGVLGNATWMHVGAPGHLELSSSDIDSIRNEKLDVLLQFSALRLDAFAPTLARHGVWAYAHGDLIGGHDGSEQFWEIHRGDPVAATELRRLEGDASATTVLYRSFGSTHPHSLELGRAAARWKASNFVMRCLRRIANGQPPEDGDHSGIAGLHRVPGNLQMGRFMARYFGRKARALIQHRLGKQDWSIAWRKGRMDPASPDVTGMKSITAPAGHFYADPFVFRHQGRTWLFLEDFDYSQGKASVLAMACGDGGPEGDPCVALRLPEHLSYPCVFEWRGQVYMVPQIGETGGPVRLFRATRFPGEWELASELLSGYRAVDATLHPHNGRWYMFANICEAPFGSENDELFLFHADTPLGPFHPHPANPVVSDVRRARPAGRLFNRDGTLIRPSQDSAAAYGHALVFNEVLELSPQRYSERVLGRLAPGAEDFLGCHTYNSLDDFEVIDLKHQRFRHTTPR